jgi:hypothetical protein
MMRWNPGGFDAKPKIPHFAAGETAALDVAIVEETSEELRVGVMLDKDALDTTELDATELDATELDATELDATELDATELDEARAQSRAKPKIPVEPGVNNCVNVNAAVEPTV